MMYMGNCSSQNSSRRQNLQLRKSVDCALLHVVHKSYYMYIALQHLTRLETPHMHIYIIVQ